MGFVKQSKTLTKIDKLVPISDSVGINIMKADGVTTAINMNTQDEKIESSTGEAAVLADEIAYDNSISGLTATDVKSAIDELSTATSDVAFIVKPVATSSGTINNVKPTLNSSAFQNIINQATHTSTDWEVYNSVNALVFSSYDNTANKTSIVTSVLTDIATYTYRVRYKDSFGNLSEWSDVSTFYIPDDGVNQPLVAAPAAGTNVQNGQQYTSSVFGTILGTDTHYSSDWEVRKVSDDSVVVFITDSTSNKTTWTPSLSSLTSDTTIKVRVRHKGTNLGYSEWSAYREYNYKAIAPGAVLANGDIVVSLLSGSTWLVVAPATRRTNNTKWGLYGTDVAGLTNIAAAGTPDPNTGNSNTGILNSATYRNVNDGQGSIGSPAAKYCAESHAQVYDLPNKEELKLIYQNKAMIDAADTSGGTNTLSYIGAGYVWSSTEYNAGHAWRQRMSDGNQNYDTKTNDNWVVPIRRFTV